MGEILIIDDDRFVCEVAKIGFDRWAGTGVVCAVSAAQGVRLLRDASFDLALINTMLPSWSGIALAQIAANLNTPVVLLTDHPASLDTLQQFDFPYLAKPFSVSQMLWAATRAIADVQQNMCQITASIARMRAAHASLADEIAVSRLLVADSQRRRQQDSRIAPTSVKAIAKHVLF